MNPTLREPEIMEIRSYDSRSFRVGDVAFFLPPQADQPVVHRIISVTPAGISTLGDNRTQKDAFLLQPKDIKGQVVAAWRGQTRRKIEGGLQGRLVSRWFRWLRILDRGVSPLLHPIYHALSHSRLIAWLLPAPLRPRVVVFQIRGQDQFQLLLGQRIIGRYDGQRHQWQIQRPFRLFVNERLLPRQQKVLYNLVLADGSHWGISAGDKEAASIVSQLGCVMRLRMTPGAIKPTYHGNLRRLLVQVDAHASAADCYVPLASENAGVVTCTLNPRARWRNPQINLLRLSLTFLHEAQARGGILIHGALAERDGMGVILAAPGGTGKTTASNRLPAPWRSLCDDTTLVVRDPQGNYWAHPWPTWSRFLDGGPGGTWDVQNAVPVKGIFFLARAVEDRVERLGPGHAVSLLVEGVRHASMFMPLGRFKEEVRALHLEGFNNLCALVRVVPAHVLHISLTGAFWQEIEQVLEGGR
jgi:hypothetical protein